MPTSLIVVALVVAWLVVLVPMIVRKRQEVAKTADTELAARVVRPAREEFTMAAEHDDPEDLASDTDVEPEFAEDESDDEPQRRYRPGRGGFDPLAAALAAKAKYAFRQRVVVTMILSAIVTAVVAGVSVTPLWWVHGAIDLALVTYLGYLRRQVRIEEEIRERRLARMSTVRRSHAHPRPEMVAEDLAADAEPRREHGILTQPAPVSHHGAVVVDLDDEDPAFDELDEPDVLPYRRAVGE